MRLVDLDAAIDHLEVEWGYEGIREDLYSLPVVDAVPVVRCKDCKHKLRTLANGVVICREKHGMVRPSLDDFCSYGDGGKSHEDMG